MADLADMIMQVYALESALLRARKLAAARAAAAVTAAAMTGLLADESMALAEKCGAACAGGLRRGRHAADATGDSAAAGAIHSRGRRSSEPSLWRAQCVAMESVSALVGMSNFGRNIPNCAQSTRNMEN